MNKTGSFCSASSGPGPPAQEVLRARILLELDENADENGAVPSHEAVPARAGVRAGPSSARTRL